MITLKNKYLTATIAPKGAELTSLINKQTGIEHMWSGDTAYWAKHSPVLFPIVGTLKKDTYFYKGNEYQLPRHGFAREKTFVLEKCSETEALFSLKNDEETFLNYPFEFKFNIRYRLLKSTITVSYEVENNGSKNMLFSAGAHPAFAVPMLQGYQYEDYYLQFAATEKLIRHKLESGLIGNVTENIVLENGMLRLEKSLFYEDAIVLKNLQSDCISLSSNNHSHGIHFCFKDFPYFGIWASKDAPFICLEPWCGIADNINHNQQLSEKEGIISLAPNAGWERMWSVECF